MIIPIHPDREIRRIHTENYRERTNTNPSRPARNTKENNILDGLSKKIIKILIASEDNIK